MALLWIISNSKRDCEGEAAAAPVMRLIVSGER